MKKLTQKQKDGLGILGLVIVGSLAASTLVVHGPVWYSKAMSIVKKPAAPAAPIAPPATT